ncbi:MAG: RNA 3'-terminal phosphate cyclase [candidate division Zixibacteria bacterium RBG-1]|nr:MAG: RNA 3'-terminal phosphate cyclase [candidate division Zixibacteria bacterium RBG-1]OGC86399.1 MAG: RNA 3'-terminal-phosphate cyclase [candidate division Zixibacteria bacterium RBG_19FT_COMBO_42_43]
MLRIDGNYGEGGGQILRTALALSLVLQKPIEIYNIRKGRKNPGLAPQHLTSVNAAAKISGAQVEGNKLKSEELKFSPGQIKAGQYLFNVAEERGSAGSVALVLQSILLPLSLAAGSSKVTLLGGTHVPFSPPFTYYQEIFFPTLQRLGLNIKSEIKRCGFYPKGGGEVVCEIQPVAEIKNLNLLERGKLLKLSGISAMANLPLSIADRQKNSALKLLQQKNLKADIKIIPAFSFGQGTFFFLKAEFENCAAGFGSLGEMGKRAEIVAEEAVSQLLQFLSTDAVIEEHSADQLIPFLALAKQSSAFTVSKISKHLLTNIWVVKQFLEIEISLEGEEGQAGKVMIKPAE